MQVSANYPTPVVVNGFICRNCTDVDNAKKHIDPAHPKSGPFDVNARTDPSRIAQQALDPAKTATAVGATPPTSSGLLDITV